MNVCVFCGSSTGLNPVYGEAARQLGSLIGKHSATLVYGGGKVGLMGITADAVMANGGNVIGVIPEFLVKREVGHHGVTELEIVDSMHERKNRMADLANAFIAMPGGWGTLEEVSEILTWKQLGLIDQPVIILNINGFFDPLLKQIQSMLDEGFLKPEYIANLKVATTPEDAIRYIIPH
jgi:uncharacterized protein (TIGR00730 family)